MEGRPKERWSLAFQEEPDCSCAETEATVATNKDDGIG